MAETIRISPGALNFQLRRSECMLRKKHFTEAVNIAQKVASLGYFNAEAYYTLGLIYYHRDMPELALKSLECCLRNDQEYRKAKDLMTLIKNIMAGKGRANDFLEKGKYQEALRVYQNILKLQITDNDEVVSKMWYNCALMQSKLYNTEDAIYDCTKALISNPRYYQAFSMRAECHSKLLNYDECVRDCISAYDIEKTDHVKTLFNESLKKSSKSLMEDHCTILIIASGKVLLDSGKYKEAIEKLSSAIRICPMNMKFYEYRIECAIKSEKFDLALRDLDLLTLISNNNDTHMLIRVECLLLKGDLDEAKKLILDVYNTGHNIAEDYKLLDAQVCKVLELRSCFEEKQYGAFISLWDIFCESFHMKYLGISYKLMRAECLYNLCDYNQTMIILNEIIQSESSNARAIYLKGLVFYQMMKFDKAIEQFNECLVFDWDNDDSQFMLKRATELQSKYSFGVQLYRTEYFEQANMKFAEMLKLLDKNNERNIFYSVLHEQAKCLLECDKYVDCINKCVQISENMKSIKVKSLLDSAKEKWKTTRNTLHEGILISRSADNKIIEGQSYYDEKDSKKACASFSEAIAITSKYSQSMTMNSRFLKNLLCVASYSIKMGDLCQTESILHRLEELKLVDPAINFIIQNYRQLGSSVKNAIKFFKESDYHECRFHIDNALKIASASDDFKMISAECSVRLGEYNKALQILESLDSSTDDDYIRGMIAYLQNDLDGAMDYLKRCVTSDNGHNSVKHLISNSQLFKNRIQKSNELMENVEFEDAINIFTDAMAVDKKNTATKSELHLKCKSASKLIPNLAKAREMRDQCEAELNEIEKKEIINQNAAKQAQKGDAYKVNGNLDNSIKSYTEAIDLQPNNVTYYVKRAECYFLMEDFESTLDDARKATQLDKTIFDCYIWEAKCLIKLGQTESEIKIFQQLENMDIMDTGEFRQKMEVSIIREICSNYKKGNFADCIKQIDFVFKYFPNSLYYKIKQTKCLIRLFQLNSASKNIQQLEASNCSRISDVYLLKGLLNYFNDYYEEAVKNLSACNTHNKDEEAEMLIKRCKVLQNVITSVNDKKKRLRKFDIEIAKYDFNKWESDIRMRLFYQKALFQHKLGEKKGSLEDCSLALKENPKYVNALKLRIKLQRESGRFEDCLRDYELLLAIDEDDGIKEFNETNDRASISSTESVQNVCNQDSTIPTIVTNNNLTFNCCLKMNIINNIRSIGKCFKFW